jgi:carbamoyltransferase
MRIVAFSVAHDASVCAINDGKIEFFAKEERLSRKKRDNSPFLALDLYHSLNFGKVDKFLYVTPSNTQPIVESMFRSYIQKKFKVELENYSSLKHHAAHAALAFNNSKFEESLVFVIDRDGSIFFMNNNPVCRESESVFYCDKKEQKEIYKSFWSFNEKERYSTRNKLETFYQDCDINVNNRLSVVKVYEAATMMINQSPLENGKTMGLSSYGENIDYHPLFMNGCAISEYFSHLDNGDESPCFYGDEHLISNVTEENYRYYANKAKHVQQETQKEVLRLIKKYTKKTGIQKVCIVGGYGLNVIANNFYIKNCPDLTFYFEPVADDTGVSIGACILKNKEIHYESSVDFFDNKFYHYYDWDEKTTISGKSSNIKEICDLLIQQKSVAIFDGHPEAGPRALGHRSILFDPRNCDAKNIVNKIKNREWYRPFAGIILESEFEKYFDTLGIKSSEFMTINFNCYPETKKFVPGIIHVDGTCRIQTVADGFIFELLTEFYKKTGCPMILNTSFNLAGESLVQTKQHAIETLQTSSLDAVYFVDENKLVFNID